MKSMHPVLSLLASRKAAGSLPGKRSDNARLALVAEGGAMRGIVSCAMFAELEAAGLRETFDLVVGCSAGAMNAAAFLAGVAAACRNEYYGAFASRAFINPWRFLVGKAPVDVQFSIDFANAALDAERHRRAWESPIPLHCLATEVEGARKAVLSDFRDVPELRTAYLATSCLPLVAGGPIAFRGKRYLDGGLVEAIPVKTAIELGATHVLVLQTRPTGTRYPRPKGLGNRLAERMLEKLNPDLVPLFHGRGEVYDATCAFIEAQEALSADASCPVFSLRLPAGSPSVGRLETDRAFLRERAEDAGAYTRERLVEPVLREACSL